MTKRIDSRLRAVVDMELAQDGCHVILDRLLAHIKPQGDLFVAGSKGHHIQDLHLSRLKRSIGIG